VGAQLGGVALPAEPFGGRPHRRLIGRIGEEVVDGGPADRAGLKAGGDAKRFQARTVSVGGDIVVAVNGRKLRSEGDLGVALLRYSPGDRITLRVYRDGKRRDVKVTLGNRPKQTGQVINP